MRSAAIVALARHRRAGRRAVPISPPATRPRRPEGGTLRLVAYSTPREAYAKLIADFKETTPGATRRSSSPTAPRASRPARDRGLKADVVALSLEPDMTSLVKAEASSRRPGRRNRYDGMVTRSVVVFAVRKGNPKKIRTWADLIKPDVDVVTPNVQTSGGAKWNVMAAYGAQRKIGLRPRAGGRYLEKLYDHVVSQDKSAREALQTFIAGRGDVLLAYENEAIFAQKKNQPHRLRDPEGDDHDREPDRGHEDAAGTRPTARAFLRYLRTKPAQRRSSARTATARCCAARRSSSASRSRGSSSRSSTSAAGRRSTSSSSTRGPGS